MSAGDPLVFTVTVKNEGQGVAQDAQLRDQLPPGVTWTIKVAPEGAGSRDLRVRASNVRPRGPGGERARQGSSSPRQPRSRPAPRTTTPPRRPAPTTPRRTTARSRCPRPDLVLKTPDGQTVIAGSPIEFAITVTNDGPGIARDVRASDPLPPGPTWIITQQPLAGSCAIAGSTLTCDIGDPPPRIRGSRSRSACRTSATQCAVYDNTATATAPNQPDDVLDSGSITCSITSPGSPDLPIPRIRRYRRIPRRRIRRSRRSPRLRRPCPRRRRSPSWRSRRSTCGEWRAPASESPSA